MKIADKVEHVSNFGDYEFVRATVVANSTPSPLPTTGADVEGMSAKQKFAPLSVLIVPSEKKVYITDEDGVFRAW